MYQIALGDDLRGFLILDGASAAPPAFKATPYFNFSPDPVIQETIEIQLKGTAAQIDLFIARLQQIAQLVTHYQIGSYQSPQYLRFQMAAGGDYFSSPLSSVFLESNPAGFLHQPTGSKVIILHYTRPNYFDGSQPVELPLTGRAGPDVLGGYPWVNHTDSGFNHGSTVLIKPTDLTSHLPAPLRVSFARTTLGEPTFKDFFFGLYHSFSYASDGHFFYHYNSIEGGSAVANPGAIEGYYKTRTYTDPNWFNLFKITLPSLTLANLQGHTYRYFLHLFAPHAYPDLYMKVSFEVGGVTLFESDPVHSPPGVGYVILPPLELPPNYLLWEVNPLDVDLFLSTYRESGAATTLSVDCVTLFPLAPAASFYGFYNLPFNAVLIDDSSRQRHNMRIIANNYETIAHARVGGPLLVHPGQNTRFFAYVADSADQVPIDHAATLRLYYYPRRQLL